MSCFSIPNSLSSLSIIPSSPGPVGAGRKNWDSSRAGFLYLYYKLNGAREQLPHCWIITRNSGTVWPRPSNCPAQLRILHRDHYQPAILRASHLGREGFCPVHLAVQLGWEPELSPWAARAISAWKVVLWMGSYLWAKHREAEKHSFPARTSWGRGNTPQNTESCVYLSPVGSASCSGLSLHRESFHNFGHKKCCPEGLWSCPLPPRNIQKWEHGPHSRALPLPQQLPGVQECLLELYYKSGETTVTHQHGKYIPPKKIMQNSHW